MMKGKPKWFLYGAIAWTILCLVYPPMPARIFKEKGSMFWKLKTENKKIDKFHFKLEQTQQ